MITNTCQNKYQKIHVLFVSTVSTNDYIKITGISFFKKRGKEKRKKMEEQKFRGHTEI